MYCAYKRAPAELFYIGGNGSRQTTTLRSRSTQNDLREGQKVTDDTVSMSAAIFQINRTLLQNGGRSTGKLMSVLTEVK